MKRLVVTTIASAALSLAPAAPSAQARYYVPRPHHGCRAGFVRRSVNVRRHQRRVKQARCYLAHRPVAKGIAPAEVSTPAPSPNSPELATAPIAAPTPITIALLSLTTDAPAAELPAVAEALQIQANRDLAPAYANVSAANLNFTPAPLPAIRVTPLGPGESPPADAWTLTVMSLTDTEQMGFHDHRASGLPYAEVSTQTGVSADRPWTMTASHELEEMLLDPANNGRALAPDGTVYAYEASDAVEGRSYQINNVTVSDFVTPAWYVSGSPGPWDFLGATTAPFQAIV